MSLTNMLCQYYHSEHNAAQCTFPPYLGPLPSAQPYFIGRTISPVPLYPGR